jgi:outer membrane protein TolC
VAAYHAARRLVADDDPAIVEAARRYRDRSRDAFRDGKRDVIDLLDAQREYRERLQNEVTNRADYWRALYRLNAAANATVVPVGAGAADAAAPLAD